MAASDASSDDELQSPKSEQADPMKKQKLTQESRKDTNMSID